MSKYECNVTTGPNMVGYYNFNVTVLADSEDEAIEKASRKGQRELMWFSPLKVLSVKRVL